MLHKNSIKNIIKIVVTITGLIFLLSFSSISLAAVDTDCTSAHPTYSCVDCGAQCGSLSCFSGFCSGGTTRQCCPSGIGSGGSGIRGAADRMGIVAQGLGYRSGSVDLPIVIGNIIKSILSFIGILFLILIIVSGIQWMTAGGNEDTVKKSKARIKNAIYGLAITLFAYAITYFITYTLFSSQETIENTTNTTDS